MSVDVDVRLDLEFLRDLRRSLGGNTQAARPLMRAILLNVQGLHMTVFRNSGARFGGWDDISPLTAAFRATGRGGKAVTPYGAPADWTPLRRAAAMMKPLQDTGLMAQSIIARRPTPASVRDINGMKITFGTTRTGSEKHQHGGTSTFRMTAHKMARLVQRVPPWQGYPGGKSPRYMPNRRDGEGNRIRSSALKKWNPLHGLIVHGLPGREYRIPKRQFLITRFNAVELRDIDQTIFRFIRARYPDYPIGEAR